MSDPKIDEYHFVVLENGDVFTWLNKQCKHIAESCAIGVKGKVITQEWDGIPPAGKLLFNDNGTIKLRSTENAAATNAPVE